MQYPGIRFHSDLSGVKLHMGTVAKMKALNAFPGFPDLVIYHSAKGFCGLALEIKKEGSSPFKKDDKLKAGDHLKNQAGWLNHLAGCGFRAQFITGFDEAKEVIDRYLK
jgi:hypothetical protein